MVSHDSFRFVATAVAAGALCFGARGDLPPVAYPDPKGASEILVVEVVEATATETGSDERKVDYSVVVRARVREAAKSGQGLKAGDLITIRYGAWKARPPKPGQGTVVGGEGTHPVLEKSQTYRVHLEPDKVSHERNKDPYYAPKGAPYNAMVEEKPSGKAKQ